MNNLLNEAASSNQIIQMMKSRRVASIDYIQPPGEGVSGYRYIEIYAYGTTKAGNPCIIGWLRNDLSSSLKSGRKNDAIRWRIFRLDKIRALKYATQTYDTTLKFISTERPELNLNYRNLGTVYYKIIPDNEPLPPVTDIKAVPPTRPGELPKKPDGNTETTNK
jgi:hypothetical protein